VWFLWLKVIWCDSACPITGQALQVWFLWLEPVEVTQHNPHYSIQCYSTCPVIGEAMQRWFLWPKPLKHTQRFSQDFCPLFLFRNKSRYIWYKNLLQWISLLLLVIPVYISSPPPHLGGGDVNRSHLLFIMYESWFVVVFSFIVAINLKKRFLSYAVAIYCIYFWGVFCCLSRPDITAPVDWV